MNKEEFKELLEKTKIAFNQSKIKEYCDHNNLEWTYSVCATQINTGSPLIVGFNWGAAKNSGYPPQTNYPERRFVDLSNIEIGSLSRVVPYLKRYFSEDVWSRIGQVNYCFFQSAKANQIHKHDIELCKPLFLELMQKAKPEYILAFSSRLRNDLLEDNEKMLENIRIKEVPFMRGGRQITYEAMNATFTKTECAIYFLPHPNYPISASARNEVWDYYFKKY